MNVHFGNEQLRTHSYNGNEMIKQTLFILFLIY